MKSRYPQIDNYEVVRILGQGGAGIVYDAVDLRDGSRVAIKSLFPSHLRDPYILERFILEANNYLYLEHQNIVDLKDLIIVKDKAYYLVMEHINGKSLDGYINHISGPIPQERMIPIFCQILKAIAHAHHNDKVHLDIKPSNIMISDRDFIKVLDFGIAQSISKGENKRILGTPMFMSPEQITLKKLDRRTDIYALGVTLHYIVTGRYPYPTNLSVEEVFEAIKEYPLLRAETFYPLVTDEIQIIIDRATAKLPEDRFQSCEEFEFHIQSLNSYA